MALATDISMIDTARAARRERFHNSLGNLRAHNKDLSEKQRRDRIAKTKEKKKPVRDRLSANMLGKSTHRKVEITVALRLMRIVKGLPLTRKVIDKCPRCGHLSPEKIVDIHALPPEGALSLYAEKQHMWMIESFGLYDFMNGIH